MQINEMGMIVDNIFASWGVKTNRVSVRHSKRTIAGAIGLQLSDNTTLSGLDVVTLLGFQYPVVGGIIEINEKYIQKVVWQQ